MNAFSRTELLFSAQPLAERLAQASEAVFGIGVGGYTVEALHEAGVGALT